MNKDASDPRTDCCSHRFAYRGQPVPAVVSLYLQIDAPPKAIDLSCLLLRSEPRVVSLPVICDAPLAITVPITHQTVCVRSFIFPDPAETPRATALQKQCSTSTTTACAKQLHVTRIKPPGDVIKLEDRLRYLLQPSLESLLDEGALRFPCRPYPYQFEGMAFLYPRHAAILADEMGLGKTMQAITAIRLLLHRQEIRRVLLVCPKPLAANWRREFSQWAPELPVMLIEGDQDKRAWQWQLPDAPIKIANYEILLRDREMFEKPSPLPKGEGTGVRARLSGEKDNNPHPNPLPKGEGTSVYLPKGEGTIAPPFFDLVVLDESQRIKNRSGATSQIVRSISRKRSWALTGTPVENSTDDLVGIFEFLAPGSCRRI